MEINLTEQLITEDALNHYYYYVEKKLKGCGLGAIERENYEINKKRLSDLLARFRKP